MTEVKVPDIGDFKDVPVIEVMVKPGDVVAVKENSRALAYFKDLAEDMASRDIASWVEVDLLT